MNRWFTYRDRELHVEAVSLADIARQFGTPVYVYSRRALIAAFEEYHAAMPAGRGLVCFAVKANTGRAVLSTLASCGAGFDIVSGGELERVIAAGGDPGRVIFSGIGKSAAEMRLALRHGIRCFNVESEAELQRLNAVALETGTSAPVSLRLNPGVDADTHHYISTGGHEHKFGIPEDSCLALAKAAEAAPGIELTGIACHIGSQIFREETFGETARWLVSMARLLQNAGISVRCLDFGGGLGVATSREPGPQLSRAGFVNALLASLPDDIRDNFELIVEPGRSIVADSGVLLTRIEYLKPGAARSFAIVDAAMNNLLRPALYNAWHDIVPVVKHPGVAAVRYDVVGPVCETGDFLGHDRELAVRGGDLLAVMQAGAYAASMSSTYNSRPRAAEVMVDTDVARLIRRRGDVADLMAGETEFCEQPL